MLSRALFSLIRCSIPLVRAQGNVSLGDPDPYTLAAAVRHGRHKLRQNGGAARGGVFDRYLYNSIRFEVSCFLAEPLPRTAYPPPILSPYPIFSALFLLLSSLFLLSAPPTGGLPRPGPRQAPS